MDWDPNNYIPPSDLVPVYHCFWCRARVVGQENWKHHGQNCKAPKWTED